MSYIKTVDNKVQAGDIKEVDGANSATLNINEILSEDVYGAKYSFATAPIDPRVASYKVVLGDQNANDYILISANDFSGGAIKITKKAKETAINTPPLCNVTVQITDQWGKVTSVNVPVKVVK